MSAELKVYGISDESQCLGRWSLSWNNDTRLKCVGSKWREHVGEGKLNTLEDFYDSIDSIASSTIKKSVNELTNVNRISNFRISHPTDAAQKIEGAVELLKTKSGNEYILTASVSLGHMEANRRSRNLLDTLSQAIMVSQSGKPVFVNKSFAALLGFDGVDEVLTRGTLKDCFPSEGWQALNKEVKNGANDFQIQENYEFCLTRQDGSRLETKCHVDHIDWDDEPANMLSIVDVTEIKALHLEDRVSRKLFRKIFDLSPDMTIIVDMDTGKIIDVNSAFVEITGLPRKDAVDVMAKDLSVWADNTVRDWLTHKMHSQTSARNMPVVLNARGGMYRQLTVSAESIQMDGKRLLLIVARDISDDLTREREMVKSRDEANMASRTKSEFLANMSHELRTPLNAILGFSEIISGEMLGPVGSPKYSEYANDIFTSGAHLLSIINDILDLSKVEAGQLDIFEEDVQAISVVKECVRLVEQKAEEEGVNLHVDCPEEFSFWIDPKLFKQIMLNLLSNAVKFTPEKGDVYLKFTVSGDNVILSVRDSGIGMTAKELEKAMKPFGQIDTEQARKHQGSGLGLPLINAFAQKMNGEFLLSSESGKGTTAKVILPLRHEQ